jgi:hypothetical protein
VYDRSHNGNHRARVGVPVSDWAKKNPDSSEKNSRPLIFSRLLFFLLRERPVATLDRERALFWKLFQLWDRIDQEYEMLDPYDFSAMTDMQFRGGLAS